MASLSRSTLLVMLVVPFAFACNSATDAGASGDCTQSAALTVGTAVSGDLATSDCKSEGAYEDNFTFTLASPTIVKVTVTSANASEFIVAHGTLTDGTVADLEFSGSSTFYAALPAGAHIAQMISDKTGSYTINVSPSSLPSGCIVDATPVYVTRGSVITGSISNSDCVNNSYFSDPYRIAMVSNQNYSFSASGSMGINLELNRAGTVLAHMNTANNAAGSVTLPYRATQTDNHNIGVIAIPQNTFGSYTFSVQ